jgi:outer membrane protein assembly factor BamA
MSGRLFAQAGKDTVRKYDKDSLLSGAAGMHEVPQKDMSDVLKSIFAKKRPAPAIPDPTKVQSPNRKLTFTVLPAVGYTLTTKTAFTVTGNVTFQAAEDANTSTIISSAAYTQRKQFTVPLETNIWTKHNTYDFVGDIHFMKYPQDTYGLGSNSSIDNVQAMNYNYIRFYEVVLRKITPHFFAGFGYILDWRYHITADSLPNGVISDYHLYGAAATTLSTGFTLNALYDTRDNTINPYRGFYAEVTYRNNQRFMGSNSDWQSTIIDVRKYFKWPQDSRNILAFWSYDWLTLTGKPPYLDLPSTNWDRYSSTGRGYIQGRFRGKEMVYLESEYRFPLTANGLIGSVLYFNVESFSGLSSNRLQSFQPGYGTGLRIKLNKTSRTNVDIDYGFGMQGSQGFFVNIGELF